MCSQLWDHLSTKKGHQITGKSMAQVSKHSAINRKQKQVMTVNAYEYLHFKPCSQTCSHNSFTLLYSDSVCAGLSTHSTVLNCSSTYTSNSNGRFVTLGHIPKVSAAFFCDSLCTVNTLSYGEVFVGSLGRCGRLSSVLTRLQHTHFRDSTMPRPIYVS